MPYRTLLFRLILVAVASIATTNLSQAAENIRGEVGRYQLLAAKTNAGTKSGMAEMNTVFKIDTATGQTWVFLWSAQGDGTIIQQWLPIK